MFEVVKAYIVGSVMGDILLVLSASMFFGGLKHKTQNFNEKVVEVTSSMLIFAVIGLCVPAIITRTMNLSSL